MPVTGAYYAAGIALRGSPNRSPYNVSNAPPAVSAIDAVANANRAASPQPRIRHRPRRSLLWSPNSPAISMGCSRRHHNFGNSAKLGRFPHSPATVLSNKRPAVVEVGTLTCRSRFIDNAEEFGEAAGTLLNHSGMVSFCPTIMRSGLAMPLADAILGYWLPSP